MRRIFGGFHFESASHRGAARPWRPGKNVPFYQETGSETKKGDVPVQNIEPFFQQYRDDVYRLALSYTRSIQEAEDVCQTVFLKFLEQEHITAGKERAWLMQVTANVCRNLLRSSWWRSTVALDDSLSTAPPEYSGLYQAVMGLKPKYRVVVYLHYYECCTTQQIAQLLKVSRSVVTTRLNRARQMLKEAIQEVPT